MKKIITLSLLANLLISGACNFSAGVKNDLRTGLSFRYNGFIVKDVLLIDPTHKRMTDNKVKLNTRIAIVALGINNYGLKRVERFCRA